MANQVVAWILKIYLESGRKKMWLNSGLDAGTPLPINDLWIVLQTIESGAVRVTFDAHFEKVSGLRFWIP